jgi:hypothetical protein
MQRVSVFMYKLCQCSGLTRTAPKQYMARSPLRRVCTAFLHLFNEEICKFRRVQNGVIDIVCFSSRVVAQEIVLDVREDGRAVVMRERDVACMTMRRLLGFVRYLVNPRTLVSLLLNSAVWKDGWIMW